MNLFSTTLLYSLVLCITPVNGQDIPGTLTVTGEAKIKVKPDEVIASFRMESKDMAYEKTIKILGDKTDQLAKVLKKIGFSSEDLKSSQLMVSKNYIYSNSARRDSGYVASQILELRFPMNSEAIIELVNTVSGASVDPQLSFDFQISEAKSIQVKENLISLAVKDARKKAEIIAESSVSEIQGVHEISYGNIPGPEPAMYRMMESSSADMPEYGGFNVQDLTFREIIIITYNIISKR